MGKKQCKFNASHGDAESQELCASCYSKWRNGNAELVKELGPFRKVRRRGPFPRVPAPGTKKQAQKTETSSLPGAYNLPPQLDLMAKLELAAGYNISVVDLLKLIR